MVLVALHCNYNKVNRKFKFLLESIFFVPDYSVNFCTVCKSTVTMSNIEFVKLANNKITIRGCCNNCGTVIIKGRVLPKTGKNPLAKYRRKLAKKRLHIYRPKIKQDLSF